MIQYLPAAEEVRTLARAGGPNGEIALRRRTTDDSEIDELIVNGAFAMDSAETSTEIALARIVARPDARVLVGGLGLGFTAAELLRRGVATVDVVEVEASLVEWARDGVTDTLAAVARDSRTRLHVADIADVLLATGPAGSDPPPIDPTTRWDAILLDVDNGPDFLIHDANARIYRPDLLGAAADRLLPGGTLAVWCQGRVPELADTLRDLGGQLEVQLLEVIRDARWLAYAIYTLTR